MRRVTPDQAIAAIPAGARVVLPHGCVEPRSLFDALGRSAGHAGNPPLLYSGLQFGPYTFLGEGVEGGRGERGGLGSGYRYVTWQVGARIRDAMRGGRIGFLPLRFRDVPRMFGPGGRLAADVAILQSSPPVGGMVNLGISSSIFPAVLGAARLVIAEIHPDMPRLRGDTEVPVDRIDLAVEASAPLGTLARAEPDAVDRSIVERVIRLLPEDAWIQLGIGAVPNAVLARLAEVPGAKLHSGMLTDALGDFLNAAGSNARVVTGEIEGSTDMYERAAADPRVVLRPTTLTHDVPYLARLERFVSINSAIEVDLWGQVNGEAIDSCQVSGVGGSIDFAEGASSSPGGLSIVALRSTAHGRSRIVPRLAEGTPVSLPRFATDAVVTEHGVARLAGLTLEDRAQALIAIAAPHVRAWLRSAVEDVGRGSGSATRRTRPWPRSS